MVGSRCYSLWRCTASFKLLQAWSAGSHESHLPVPLRACVCVVCRELAHMYSPLSLVAMPDLKECLGKLKGHQVRGYSQEHYSYLAMCW